MLYLHQRLFSPRVARPPEEEEPIYKTDGTSIGHRVLDEDRRAENVPSTIYKRLDAVVLRVESEVSVGDVTTIDEARAVLEEVEKVITSTNFVCSIPYYLVHSFSQGLLEKDLDRQLINVAENGLRRSHIIANEQELFSHVDCDLSSLLYLSIAEALALPLRMVEVPDHNFVRWRLNDDTHLNWDTNFGFNKYKDSGYAARYGVDPEQSANGVYLTDLSTDNVEGYFCFVRGLTFQRVSLYADAVGEYRKGIIKYPQSPAARNNIAWLFVSVREVQQMVTKEEALQFALKACDLHRTDNNLDTLGCVYAEHGDFQAAIRIETEAYDLNPLPSYREMIEAFRNGETWLDVHGG